MVMVLAQYMYFVYDNHEQKMASGTSVEVLYFRVPTMTINKKMASGTFFYDYLRSIIAVPWHSRSQYLKPFSACELSVHGARHVIKIVPLT